jgi:hypothetical protein
VLFLFNRQDVFLPLLVDVSDPLSSSERVGATVNEEAGPLTIVFLFHRMKLTNDSKFKYSLIYRNESRGAHTGVKLKFQAAQGASIPVPCDATIESIDQLAKVATA